MHFVVYLILNEQHICTYKKNTLQIESIQQSFT